jgi:uncharacterized protein (TIGR03067 family)
MRKTRWLIAAAALAVLPFGAGGAEDKDAKFDAAKVVGNWTYVSGEKNGQKVDPAGLKDQVVTITKDTITLKGPTGTFVMKYELDAKANPAGIKLTMTESPFGAGATAAGIIAVSGDELKFAYNPTPGGAAPKAFEAKADSGHHNFVLKRAAGK